MRPPCSPAPGPRSTTQSAERIVSSSCSTTMTVLPRSRMDWSVSMSLRLSRWWRPIEGSSSTYRTPISFEPICVARRMRCDSPPERDAAPRERFRYPIPTLSRKRRRSRISLRIFPAISCSRGVSSRSLEERDDVGDRLRRHLVDRTAPDPHRERLGLQPPPQAGRARLGRHVRLELGALLRVLGLAVAPLDHRDEALERGAPVVLALLGDVGELDLVLARPIEDDLLRRLRQLAAGLVEAGTCSASRGSPSGASASSSTRVSGSRSRRLSIDSARHPRSAAPDPP